MFKKFVGPILVLLGCFFSSEGNAIPNTEQQLKSKASKDGDVLLPGTDRFGPFEPNYVICKFVSGFDNSINLHYSFYYIFHKGRLGKVFLKYTGEFDFYALVPIAEGHRNSSPVINRISNPGIHYRTSEFCGDQNESPLKWIGVGIEHLSNGQVVDVSDTLNGGYITQSEFENGNEEYFDFLSRGSDYISAEFFLKWGKFDDALFSDSHQEEHSLSLWTRAKCFYSNSSNIMWGELAHSDTSIEDYDIARFVLTQNNKYPNSWLAELQFGLEYTIGKKCFQTDSLDITILAKIKWNEKFRTPFYLRAHAGPSDVFSDYTRVRNSWGFGLLFN